MNRKRLSGTGYKTKAKEKAKKQAKLLYSTRERLAINSELLENYDESNIILPTDDTVPVVDKECEAINNENRFLHQIYNLAVSMNSSDNIAETILLEANNDILLNADQF
ncbi:hypothetical protein QTP88_013569 [Uroleucon formosanum]